jgi:FdrA protein
MHTVIVKRDSFYDSIMLMQVSAALEASGDFEHVTVAMCTPVNVALLQDLGFGDDIAGLGPADLVIAVEGDDLDGLEGRVDQLLTAKRDAGVSEHRPVSIADAIALVPGANLALISVPGAYAAYEAERALRAGLHVMLFSDNVSVDDEVALKDQAAERGLLCMGPDCGTAILGGRPLAFANVVRRGPVGVVGASGTGIQEVSCLLDRAGVGVSQAIGTGGRDLSAAVGGRTMLAGIAALDADPATSVLLIVSKPPAPKPSPSRIIATLEQAATPSVVHFLGQGRSDSDGRVWQAATLEEAALMAARPRHPAKQASSTSP